MDFARCSSVKPSAPERRRKTRQRRTAVRQVPRLLVRFEQRSWLVLLAGSRLRLSPFPHPPKGAIRYVEQCRRRPGRPGEIDCPLIEYPVHCLPNHAVMLFLRQQLASVAMASSDLPGHPLRHAQKFGRFQLAQNRLLPACVNVNELASFVRIARSPAPLLNPPSDRSCNRTTHAPQKTNISPATDT